MTSRCPRCGKNNYGDVQKCSFCGSPLVFIPGEKIEEISQEDIQEKMDKMKVSRIRNPFFIGAGGAVTVIGLFIAIAVFLIVMLVVFDPGDVSPYYDDGMHYGVPGGEEYIFGEITNKRTDEETPWINDDSHGYTDDDGGAYTAYQIGGAEDDGRPNAQDKRNAALEPDTWIYSDEDLGDIGDKVLIKVEVKQNEYGEARAVFKNRAWWGSHGWFSGGWIFALPGILITLAGGAMLTIGMVGRSDRSMERLMEEDSDLRKQQIMLREAARKKMEEKQRSQQWSNYDNSPRIAEDGQVDQDPGNVPVGETVPPTAIPQEIMGSEQGQVPAQPPQPAPQSVRSQATPQPAQPQAVAPQYQAPPPVTGQPPEQQ
ncbi:MAG: zinc ribbon domain-containing protein [Candidatus Thermoplasmatota archaeon]|nr:zinc ribbon domain-containing protein [Candidatus Thermoplasmatota archaeon]